MSVGYGRRKSPCCQVNGALIAFDALILHSEMSFNLVCIFYLNTKQSLTGMRIWWVLRMGLVSCWQHWCLLVFDVLGIVHATEFPLNPSNDVATVWSVDHANELLPSVQPSSARFELVLRPVLIRLWIRHPSIWAIQPIDCDHFVRFSDVLVHLNFQSILCGNGNLQNVIRLLNGTIHIEICSHTLVYEHIIYIEHCTYFAMISKSSIMDRRRSLVLMCDDILK